MKCYISNSRDNEFGSLVSTLDSLNVKILNDEKEKFNYELLHLNSKKRISKADFVIGILDEKNEYVLLELGMAIALGKPLYIINLVNNLPPYYLRGYTQIRYDLKSKSKFLEYNILTFLESIDKKESQNLIQKEDKKRLITAVEIEALIEDSKNYSENGDHNEVLNRIQRLFAKINIHSIQNENNVKNNFYDLAITSAKTAQHLGSPIFLELKIGKITQRSYSKALSNLNKITGQFPNSLGILLYYDVNQHLYFSSNKTYPKIYAFELVHFLKEIATEGFDEFLIGYRNKINHSINSESDA